MSDLLTKLGNKANQQSTANISAEGAANAAPSQPSIGNPSKVESTRGTNLIDSVGSKSSDSGNAATSSQASAGDVKSSSGAVEPTRNETVETVPEGSWSLDSAYKEIKKLREENKQYRVKYSEQVETLKQTMEARQKAKEEEMQALVTKAQELDKLKAEQEDKKRDLSERLAHREAKLSEYQTLLEIQKKEMQEKELAYQARLAAYEAERQVEQKVYEGRLQEELSKIPEKFKDYANLIAKGAGDPRDALVALNEARLKGLFEDKFITVNHSVPGAADGARASKDKLQEAERARRSSMSSNDKIRTALEQMRTTPNSAFRTK